MIVHGAVTVAPFPDVIHDLRLRFPDQVQIVQEPKVATQKPQDPRSAWRRFVAPSALLAICVVVLIWIAGENIRAHGELLSGPFSVVLIVAVGVNTIWLLLALAFSWARKRDTLSFRTSRYRSQLGALEAGSPYLLLLRGFRKDTDFFDVGGASPQEAMLVERYHSLAPLVSIDNPRLPAFTGGAIRIRSSDDAWREVVASLSQNAAGVIIDVRDVTPGLEEEVRLHMNSGGRRCANVLLLLRDAEGLAPPAAIGLEKLIQGPQEFNPLLKAHGWPASMYVFRDGQPWVLRDEKRANMNKYLAAMDEFVVGAINGPADQSAISS